MVAKPVQLRSFRWKSIKEAKEAFRTLLNSYELDQRVNDAVHEQMLRELIEVHPRGPEKIGAGIDYFFVARTEEIGGSISYWSRRGIWIRRVDGTREDLGYTSALSGASHRVDVKDALRHAVADRRDRYRDSRFASGDEVVCVLTARPVIEADAQVIYVDPTWEQLTYRFAQQVGGWHAIEISSAREGGQIGGRIADRKVMALWLDFFDTYANPQIASRSAAAKRRTSKEDDWVPLI